MRVFITVLILALSAYGSLLKAENSQSQGCYIEVDTLKKWIDAPVGFPKESWYPEGNSFVEKEIYRSGDSIALGIIHAYARQELLVPDRLNRILSLMRLSFSQPDFIVRKENRNPAVTLLLLLALEHDAEEAQLKEKIRDSEKYISLQLAKGQTSPGQK